jgi:regulator of protease activity HflC (stomatin/prohibitin superfamily)
MNSIDEKALKTKLEKEGEKKAIDAVKSIVDGEQKAASEIFLNIVEEGMNEFKEKTGRQMTYSEMRELYG